MVLPEVFDAPLELLASVESAPAMLFGSSRLPTQLRVWLQLRQRGVLALELLWEPDARRSSALHMDAHHSGGQDHTGRLVLRTAQPTQDMVHLQRLLTEQLARVNLPAPVLHLLLERLSARLGPNQVLGIRPVADHRLGRVQHWAPALQSPVADCAKPQVRNKGAIKSVASRAANTLATALNDAEMPPQAGLYPSWLLTAPQRLVVQQGQPHYLGALELLAGPQRLDTGWHEPEVHWALRDYFVARSRVVGLLWIYRERLAGSAGQDMAHWYLHGVFA